ncbi:MAG: hypothetical protein GTO62_14390 [Planctomycetales bacterium]|nr:hypothetical protein [Planctomycetales bacterium]
MRKRNFWPALVLANVLSLCVLSFYQTSPAAAGKELPFVNPAEQREIIIEELRQLNRLVKQQNALLSSGKLAVVVAPRQVP